MSSFGIKYGFNIKWTNLFFRNFRRLEVNSTKSDL